MSIRRGRSCVDLPTGERIEYLEVGDGKPVVYFHGAGGAFRNAAFMPALGERFRVLAPSRPGYDGSTGACHSAREEAEVMTSFIDQTIGGPVHLIAESAGGAAGCWLAVLAPRLVESLILVAPAAFAGAAHAPLSTSPEAMELRLFGPRPAWSDPPTKAERAARQRNASANAARLRPPGGNADLLERLSEIAVPTLVLWGTADEVVPPEAGQTFVQRIPNSYRILIYGAAHALPVSACRQFLALATDFILRGERFVVAERP
ncbi:MAG TPA: alpha/beta hydrolase [Chloroflexota bacterium]|jgi:pimeloyl-ACP methyl ester carboxylesterase